MNQKEKDEKALKWLENHTEEAAKGINTIVEKMIEKGDPRASLTKKGKWSKERARTKSGKWRKKRSDPGKPRR